MTTQLFDEENVKVQIPYMTWEKVGDKVTGVYVGLILNSIPDMYNKIKKEYVFKQADGTYIKVSGRALPKDADPVKDYRVIFDMETVKPGTVCGIKYTEDRPNKGAQPTKILSCIYPNERKSDLEAVKEYEEIYGASETVILPEEDMSDNMADEVEI